MKRVGIIALLLVFNLILIGATSHEPSTGIGAEDKEAIEDAIDKIPIDPTTGKIDFDNPIGKTKAEERIESLNTYIGPFTNFLFGVELTLSWVFVFSLVFWILLIEIILVPVSEIFDFNFWASLLFSTIVSTLSMQGFGGNFVLYIDSLINTWIGGVFVFFLLIIVGVVYSVIIRAAGGYIKKSSEKEKNTRARRARDASTKISENIVEAAARDRLSRNES